MHPLPKSQRQTAVSSGLRPSSQKSPEVPVAVAHVGTQRQAVNPVGLHQLQVTISVPNLVAMLPVVQKPAIRPFPALIMPDIMQGQQMFQTAKYVIT